LNKNHVFIFGLLETRVRASKAARIQKKLGSRWLWSCNYGFAEKGRIWLAWDADELTVQVLDTAAQFIHCQVLHRPSGTSFIWTVIYGFNTVGERQDLWKALPNLQTSGLPWLLSGDFHSVLSPVHRINGAPVTMYETRDFQMCVDSLRLTELQFSGNFYTWCNKSIGPKRISSKLDWAFGDVTWMQVYGHLEPRFLPSSISDHSPMLLSFQCQVTTGGRPFRFLNILASHDEFHSRVAEAWHTDIQGNAMYRVWEKLKAVKRSMKILHKNSFAYSDQHIEQARQELDQVQTDLQYSPNDVDLQVKEQQCVTDLVHWLHVSESILRQKSRTDWLHCSWVIQILTSFLLQ
jgi:hypothetical protein